MRRFLLGLTAVAALLPAGAAARPETPVWPRGHAVVGYESEAALQAALARHPGTLVRRLPELRVAEVRPAGSAALFASEVSREPGIAFVERLRPRVRAAEPALAAADPAGQAYEWQWAAVRADAVPEPALRAAGGVTIAVVDTGADLAAPDLAAKTPLAYNVRTGAADVSDQNGHGTFVASLAAGSATNGDGIAGFGGDARLLVVKVGSESGALTDMDEAVAIAHAVDRGARVINLSFGGRETSRTEQLAIDFAFASGVLLVAAVGNSYEEGNPLEYPAALLGDRGLAVAASTLAGARASFSNTGAQVSLAAPGENVFGALSSLSPEEHFPRTALPGATGLYGYGSGTSFAAPLVAGSAALVWGANPTLTAAEVAGILKTTAQGGGTWTPELGWGVIDVAAAVERAAQTPRKAAARLTLAATRVGRRRIVLRARLLASAPVGARELVLEAASGSAWRQAARARTTAGGTASWRYSFTPGRYRLRVRFAGAVDLAAAASRPLDLTVR